MVALKSDYHQSSVLADFKYVLSPTTQECILFSLKKEFASSPPCAPGLPEDSRELLAYVLQLS